MQDWLQANYPHFIAKDQWLPLLAELSPISQVPSKTKNSRRTERNSAIRDSLPQEPIDINKAVKEFWKQLKACVAAGVDTLNILSDCVHYW